jgi:hypothetical protein
LNCAEAKGCKKTPRKTQEATPDFVGSNFGFHLVFSFAVLIEEMSMTRILVQTESRDLYSSSDM